MISLVAGAAAKQSTGTDSPPPGFSRRIVGVPADRIDDAVWRHVEFSVEQGFNALWIPSPLAGSWDIESAPDGPVLNGEFLRLARWCRSRKVALFVEVNPVRHSATPFVYSRREGTERILRFLRLLHKRAYVRDFVISFQDTSLRLFELQDALHYGIASAPAHLELAANIRRGIAGKDRLWLAPAVSCTDGWMEPGIDYSASLLKGLADLDPAVGIVWNGPQPLSTAVRVSDVTSARSVIGARRLLLRDRYPSGLGEVDLALAIALGPLKDREPALRDHLDGYVCHPTPTLAGSRLTLMTVADYLRSPESYEAEQSWKTAIRALSGDAAGVRDALTTQAMEWGGWIGERNFRGPLLENPLAAAELLRDPAAVASWGWVVRRYPDRMSALAKAADSRFAADLLAVMDRRLAIARAMPIVRELWTRRAAGRADLEKLVNDLARQRESLADRPDVRLAVDRFLGAAGIRLPAKGPGRPEEPGP